MWVCSATGKHDRTLELFPRDHLFINRHSYVSYAHASIIHAGRLDELLSSGVWRENLGPERAKKVRKGLRTSPFTKPAIKRALSTSPLPD